MIAATAPVPPADDHVQFEISKPGQRKRPGFFMPGQVMRRETVVRKG
jgi:hypothetical protein